MSAINEVELPPHIAYTRYLNANIRYNLSHSCAQALTLEQLLAYEPKVKHELAALALEYAPVQGSALLRDLIADFHQQYNHHSSSLTGADVVTFSGAQEALSAIYQVLLKPDDEVIVFTPNYPSLTSMATRLGAKVTSIPLSFSNQWQFSLDKLEAAINQNTKLIVLNSPHNPSGATFSSDSLNNIRKLASTHGCYVISDDVSQTVVHHDAYDTDAQQLELADNSLTHNLLDYERTIAVSVMSKAFGLGGVRIGWAVTRNKMLVNSLLALKAQGSICTSCIDEKLAEVALTHSAQIIRQNSERVTKNKLLWDAFITKHSALFSWQPPQAGLLSLMKIKLCEAEFDVLLKRLANESGILLLPAKLFGLNDTFVRVGLGQADVPQGIRQLEQFVSRFVK